MLLRLPVAEKWRIICMATADFPPWAVMEEHIDTERIVVDEQTCNGCGLCSTACPEWVFERPMQGATARVLEPGNCIVCGHCVAICPTDAIRHAEIDPARCPPAGAEPPIAPAQLLHFLRLRRSEREFRPEPVPRELLETLLDAGRCAPSASNGQEFRFIVVQDAERIRRLALLSLGPYRLASRLIENAFVRGALRLAAPDVWRLGLNYRDSLRRMAAAPARGDDPILFHAPALILIHARKSETFAETDCANAQHQIALMAEALGLGTTTVGFFIMAAQFSAALRRELSLPAGHKLYGTLIVGWPRYRWQRVPERRSAQARWE